MNREQVESLHEQASERYLEGDLDAARNAWMSLLEIAPGDDRAREGLRLCEQYEGAALPPTDLETAGGVLEDLDLELDGLVDAIEFAGASSRSPQPDLDPSIFDDLDDPPPAAESEPIAEVEGLEAMLIDYEPDGPASAAADAPAAGPPSFGPPTPDRQGEGIDVGDIDDIPSLDLDPALLPDPPAIGANTAEPPPLPEPEHESAGAAADHELNMRLSELLTEARQAAADGRDDDAFAVLARIAILDESNAPALELDEHLRARREQATNLIDDAIGEAVQWMEAGRLEEARARFAEILETAPDHQEVEHFLADAEARIAAVREAVGSDPPAEAGEPEHASPFDSDPANVDLTPCEDDFASLATATTPRFERSEPELDATPDGHPRVVSTAVAATRGRRPSPTVLGIAAVAILAAGVWFGTDRFRGPSVGPAVASEAAASADGAHEKTTAELIQEADRLASVVEDDPLTRDASDSIAARLQEADEAMASEDWEQAVLSYNDVLETDPGNPQATAGFLEAGKAYRERKALDAEYERAMRAFVAGDYTSALRVLYRLPADVRPEEVRRSKIDGWYNLGVTELRAGNLAQASSHFREVLTIDANDRLATEALEFAEASLSSPRDGAYYAEVERMEFRGPTP